MKIFKSFTAYLLCIVLVFGVCTPIAAQLQFVENKGQWDSKVTFKAEIATGAFFMENNGFTVLQQNPADLEKITALVHGESVAENVAGSGIAKKSIPSNTGIKVRSHAYKVSFLDGTGNAEIVPDKELPTYNNYFLGNDKTKWKGDCKIYQAVTYKNVYPNIDVRYYTDAGTLKYDIVVNPGGNVNKIALRYEGVDKLEVKNKELIIGTSVGEVKELYPYTYQLQRGSRQALDCKYVVKDNVVRFKVKDYAPDETIIIDPTLIFASFSGSTQDNWGYTATPGPDGSFFAGGIVFGTGFPVSSGAFDQTFNDGSQEDNNPGYDIGIIKLSPDGTTRMYATYIGGNGNEQPHSMVCDAAGNLTMAGRSSSFGSDAAKRYPTLTPRFGPSGGYDIVVTKINAAGNALIGSVVIGGSGEDGVNIRRKFETPEGASTTRRNYGDDARSEVILDGGGNILVASCTQSSDFYVAGSPIQPATGGRQDGVILKFNSNLSSLLFSTFFGGSGDDACFVLSINPLTGNLYVAGGTSSPNLPGNKNGTIGTSYQGGDVDGFVTQIAIDGSSVIRTTYLGTPFNDIVYGIQFDKFGFPYVTGTTTGAWPVINAAFSNTGSKQFIGKLQPDLSAYVYSTVFGTVNSPSPNLSPTAFLVDRCQNVYVSGWGGKWDNDRGFPNAGTSGLPVTSDAVQSTTDGNDFYFFVLEKNATSQLFGSFYGQRGGFADHVDGGTSRFDANGIIYQAICANCGGRGEPSVFFPTTPGVWAPRNPSTGCNLALIKIEMNFGGIGASVKATINGVIDTIGCVPLTVTFTDTLAKGKNYVWNFGDGSPDVTQSSNTINHTYNSVGSFRVRLVSIDSATCNISDTAYTSVRVGNNIVTPDFIPAKVGGCQSTTFQFQNTTTAVLPSYTPTSFIWDFGDNSTPQRAGFTSVSHTYPGPGTYVVKLTVDDSTFCNSPDSVKKTVRLAVNVQARFETPDKGCMPYLASFNNTSLGGIDFLWDFGDGVTSTEVNPTHLFTGTGTFNVRLTAIDTTTCNRTDTYTFPITVYPIPTAGFSFSPNPALENKPANFSNFSSGATSYAWDFGDGKTSTEKDPSHQYIATGTYNVCLVAINAAGCSDTFCLDVPAIVLPLLDVPNAFTPGKFGVNSVIKVRGFGIGKMTWKIYNRWGQNVFTSNTEASGWDGTFKGVIQPMDVYTYTLDVEFTDGKKVKKTGDISLLR